jgi:nicotinamidase-related amidase
LILTGVSTDICVQHTAADGLFYGYDIIIVSDCTAAIEPEVHEKALKYMEKVYGAKILDSAAVIKTW